MTSKKPYFQYLILSILIILASAWPSNTYGQVSDDRKLGVYPIFGYSSNTGALLGGMVLNQTPKWDSNAFLLYGQKYGYLLMLMAKDIPLYQNATLETAIRLFDWKDEITADDETRKLIDNKQYEFMIGPRYWHTTTFSSAVLLHYAQRTEYPTTSKDRQYNNEKNLGFELNIKHEGRDNHLSPQNGLLIENRLLIYPEPLRTGKQSLVINALDTRYYQTRGKHTLAFRAYFGQTVSQKESKAEGQHFFISKFRIGNNRELRGEKTNALIGQAVTLFQSEYRYKVLKKLQLTTFLEAGRTEDYIGFNNLLVTKGWGLHYSMKHNVIARLEMGYGNNTKNVIFSFNTAF